MRPCRKRRRSKRDEARDPESASEGEIRAGKAAAPAPPVAAAPQPASAAPPPAGADLPPCEDEPEPQSQVKSPTGFCA